MADLIQVNGIFPQNAIYVNHQAGQSECGIGAMIPWAGKLWYTSYGAKATEDNGSALYSLDMDMKQERFRGSVSGTYFNRFILDASGQVNIGPYLIDANGCVRVIPGLVKYDIASSFRHLTDFDHLFYVLTIDGLLLEVNIDTLDVKQLFDLKNELDFDDPSECHMTAGVSAQGKIFVASNSYTEKDYLGERAAGRLAEYDGKHWTIIERKPFHELVARWNWGETVFAAGWDRLSAILKVYAEGKWTTYRLPKGSMNFENSSAAKNVRIKEVETEGYLMDHFGIFYDLCPVAWEGKVFGIRPVSAHLKKIQDFCSYRGMLVLSGDQMSATGENSCKVSDPQTNLLFMKTDDIWGFGKPTGFGSCWLKQSVADSEASAPYLMTGFDKKMLQIRNDGDEAAVVQLQVDFTGLQEWQTYQTFTIPARENVVYPFDYGFSCHWVRLKAVQGGLLTSVFMYS